MLLTAVFLSCDPPYRSQLSGTWESISYVENDREYSIAYGDYERYSFFNDGTGVFTDEYGNRVDYYWDEYGRDQVKFRYFTGETVWAYYDFSRGDLLMTTDSSWRRYTVYRYIR